MAEKIGWDDLKKSTYFEPKKQAPAGKKTPQLPATVDNSYPTGTISFDLETGGMGMWGDSPGFIRLVGWQVDGEPIRISTSPMELIDLIDRTDGWIISHNGANFDHILLDRFCGVSILDLAKKDRLRDTKLLAFLADPPFSRTPQGLIEKKYSLENVGLEYLGEGKMHDVTTGGSRLKSLAKEFGGYDQIPQDHPDYILYLERDVECTRDLCRVLPINDYAIREHKIAAVCATISMQGFRVDIPLLEERIAEGEEKRERILNQLMVYGLPAPDSSAAPHRTNKGLAAIDTAFSDLGVSLPRTATGRPAMGKDVLQEIADKNEGTEAADLCEAIMGLNGIRTIYGNVQDNLVGDRVHPSINLRQSTGRLSIQDPGLTVMGKRGGKVKERAIFLPDSPDHVLISCDLSQVDARAVAALSQDIEYMKLFDEGRDIHTEMAVKLFGDPKRREDAKNCVHAMNYGARAKKLALMTGMPEHEAQGVIFNFEQGFPGLANWQHRMREEGELTGVLTNGYGRLMRIEPERSFTQSPALMGQSTARDILFQGILRMWAVGGEEVIRMIRGIIHDEVVVSVHKDDVEEIEHLVVDSMSFPWCPSYASEPIQITAGLNSRGQNWMEAYTK